ncbi:hypothetical protein [Rubritalea tangerina]
MSHTSLDTKATIGGSRSAAINIKKGSSISGLLNIKSGTYIVTYAKGSGGWAFLSYSGHRGEKRKLGANFNSADYESIGVTLKSAPPEGKLTITLHSAGKFKQHSLAITGPHSYKFPLSAFEGVDLSNIESIGVELHVVDAKEELEFEFSSISVHSIRKS